MRSSTSLIPYGNILSLLPAQLAGTALPFPKSPLCLQPNCHPSSLVNSHSISHPKICPDLTSPRWSVFLEHRHIYIPYIPHIHLLSFCIWYYVLRGITYQKLLILRYRLTEICKNGIESYVPFTQLPPMLRFYVLSKPENWHWNISVHRNIYLICFSPLLNPRECVCVFVCVYSSM